MTNSETWSTAGQLAAQWQESRVVQSFRSEFPQTMPVQEPVACMKELTLQGHTHSSPVHAYRAIPHMGTPMNNRVKMFLAAGTFVDRAVSMLTMWIRSGLPDYPNLHAPQLAAGSYHTMQDSNFDVPWFPEAMTAGLEKDPGPKQANRELGISGYGPAQKLAKAMATTDSWRGFVTAAASLTAESRLELADARIRLSHRLDEDRRTGLGYDDPRLILKRRKALTALVAGELSGPAADYARAFEEVNDDINFVVTHIFSQLLIFGMPIQMGATEGLELLPGTAPRVTFQTNEVLHVGRLYWSDDPIVADSVHVDSVSLSSSAVHGTVCSCSGTILKGSARAWRRGR